MQRELREGARRPFTFWLRVCGAAGGTVLLYLVTRNFSGGQAALGIRLFTSLHSLVLGLIFAIVPAMTADCIAREKREGTLGLLFLTPLTAGGIVVGKAFIQALRAFTLWLSVLPVLVVPFVAGGVAWADVISAVAVEFCVAIFCLAAGILASAVSKGRTTAFALALTFASSVLILFNQTLALVFVSQTSPSAAFATGINPGSVKELWSAGQSLLTGFPAHRASVMTYVLFAGSYTSFSLGPVPVRPMPAPIVPSFLPVPFAPVQPTPAPMGRSIPAPSRVPFPPGQRPPGPIIIGPPRFPRRMFVTTTGGFGPGSAGFTEGWSSYFAATAGARVWPALCLKNVVLAPLFGLLILSLAAECIKRSWQDRAPSIGEQRWRKIFCTPLSSIRDRFARRMSRALDRNPIAWLQGYSWKVRSGKWGLCLAVVVMECISAVDSSWNASSRGYGNNPDQINFWVVMVLAVIFTFVGVNSFLTEKRSGALELLLVTPLSVSQIITGRVWGLWKQILPVGITVLLCALVSQVDSRRRAAAVMQAIPIIAGFMALPVFATYFALRVKNLIVAALLTWAALGLSWVFGQIFLAWMDLGEASDNWASLAVVPLFDAGFALLACFLLRHSLSRRIYSF